MERSSIALTVLFDTPFWVGIFERVESRQLTVAKVTFGAEPKDYEVHNFVLRHFYDLKFSPAVTAEEHHASKNPKHRQRAARKQMQETGIGTKSQQDCSYSLKPQKQSVSKPAESNAKRRSSASSTSSGRSAKRSVGGIRQPNPAWPLNTPTSLDRRSEVQRLCVNTAPGRSRGSQLLSTLKAALRMTAYGAGNDDGGGSTYCEQYCAAQDFSTVGLQS